MKWAVSNIGWRPDEQDDALALLARSHVHGVETAPGLAFPSEADPLHPSRSSLDAFETKLDGHGLRPVSMQSLLFGDPQAQLFGDNAQRTRFEARMRAAIDLAGRMKIANLVFGSPASRSLPPGRSSDTAGAEALFRRLGEACLNAGCRLGLEAVTERSGTNFLNTTAAALAFVMRVDHPAIGLTLDTGAMFANDETAAVLEIVDRHGRWISHVQISAPGLNGFPADTDSLQCVLERLRRSGYGGGVVSVEMRAGPGDNIEMLKTALAICAALEVGPAG
ncbi:MAG: sugar phosphate isomerase/epimerase [Alphaproteobacteria bacterium]|nr:sugar phosphate isomerase/epimerase [Alphaproteobacteria bacterium]